MTKTCFKCKQEKDISCFRTHKSGRQVGQFFSYCKECETIRHKEWVKNNKEKNTLIKRKSQLKTIFGISLETYQEMLSNQNGACAICGKPETSLSVWNTSKVLSVDHDHKTGKVRGLLCGKCNLLLGIYESRKTEFEKYLNDTI